ncbi:DUF1499 domain-containing protein [Yoonia sp. 2307UL14-13]|uniref:DUF1499 domain-containing protein n=1 Tax=Yoonia sp. 2307UL14-13 TaxID=3126506 RepID=UPI0030B7E196
MRWLLVLCAGFVVAGLLFVRFAPAHIASVHRPPQVEMPGDYPHDGGVLVVRKITTTPDRLLHVLDDVIRRTPRTDLIAGGIAEQIMTYQTRSPWMGLPDYTTVQIVTPDGDDAPILMIDGRPRFGRSDHGTNASRIGRWLDELGLLIIKA